MYTKWDFVLARKKKTPLSCDRMYATGDLPIQQNKSDLEREI